MSMSDGGKGSAQRPTDHKSFSESFDRIFGKKSNASNEEAGRLVLDCESIKDERSTNDTNRNLLDTP